LTRYLHCAGGCPIISIVPSIAIRPVSKAGKVAAFDEFTDTAQFAEALRG
jgi:hypothetical protein